jgi:hypothetical protein
MNIAPGVSAHGAAPVSSTGITDGAADSVGGGAAIDDPESDAVGADDVRPETRALAAD